jgi:hypothetical protein
MNTSAPWPIGNPKDRNGNRLFAGCLLDFGPRSLFGDNLERILAMSPEDRWERFIDALDDKAPSGAADVFRRTLSEIDAWQEIQRIRCASRRGS